MKQLPVKHPTKSPLKPLMTAERLFLIAHAVSMAFGLAGLLLVLPNPQFIATLTPAGQALFGWGMTTGGVAYIVLGAVALSIYAYRNLGAWRWLAFLLPSFCLSLSSELLGTSTGFPFGHYQYLSGLGYKVAGLVPFTIPLSWFYMGLVSYLIADAGLNGRHNFAKANAGINFVRRIGGIALGSLLLTAWDLVLDPAMSQTEFPFWQFQEPGVFFGMPYRNLAGWMGTGALFMAVAAFLWRRNPPVLKRSQLTVPIVTYLINFAFGAIITLNAGFTVPIALGLSLGVVPVFLLWYFALPADSLSTEVKDATGVASIAPVPVVSVPSASASITPDPWQDLVSEPTVDAASVVAGDRSGTPLEVSSKS